MKPREPIAQDTRDAEARIGAAIRAARTHAGYSLADLAGMTGISQPALSRIETGGQGIGAVMVGVVSLLVDGVLFLQRVRS